jgi:hypothetical protein
VETQPLIPQVCVATAKFAGELVAIKAARMPTMSSRVIARVLGFNLLFSPLGFM